MLRRHSTTCAFVGIVVLASLAPLAAAATTPPPVEAWNATFTRSRPISGSVQYMDAEDVAADADGNAYVITTASLGSATALVKYSPAGEEVWMRALNGPGSHGGCVSSIDCSRISALALAPDGSVLVAGGAGSTFSSPSAVAHLVDGDGNVRWTYSLTAGAVSANSVWFLSVEPYPGGGFAIGGYYFRTGIGWGSVTVRLSESGAEAWRVLTPTAGSIGAAQRGRIGVDGDGFVYRSDHGNTLTKIDGTSATVWTVTAPVATAIRGAPSGGVYLAANGGISHYAPGGTLSWTTNWGNPDTLLDIEVDSAGDVLVAGVQKAPNCYNAYSACVDAVAYKLTAAGAKAWMRRYDAGFGASDYFKGISAAPSGEVYVTGAQYDERTTHYVVVTMKLGGAGASEGSGGSSGGGTGGATVTFPKPPIGEFSASPASPVTGQPVAFDDRSVDPDGRVVSWLWDFGDGTRSARTEPTHAFAAPGEYAVVLKVTDSSGLASEVARAIVVGNAPPTAEFDWLPTPTAYPPGLVHFNDGSTDVDGDVVAWRWDFGDGATSTDRNATHVYRAVGDYAVTLTATDDLGAAGARTRTVRVIWATEAPSEVAPPTAPPLVPQSASAAPVGIAATGLLALAAIAIAAVVPRRRA